MRAQCNLNARNIMSGNYPGCSYGNYNRLWFLNFHDRTILIFDARRGGESRGWCALSLGPNLISAQTSLTAWLFMYVVGRCLISARELKYVICLFQNISLNLVK